MTDKPQSAFHRAWNEPRQFFFWLTMFCAFVFSLATLFIYSTKSQYTFSNPMPPSVQVVALLSLLAGVVSLLVFFIAWIPPVRRLLVWLLRFRFLILVGFITLIALFYAVENWRGRRAWKNFQAEWNEKGETFDYESVIPSPVSTAENFFESEPWQFLHYDRVNATDTERETIKSKEVLSVYVNSSGGPKLAAAGRPNDLREWQAYYRGTNNQFKAADGTLTNFFPTSPQTQPPAKDILLALSRYENTYRQISDAAKRPRSRFWINYEDGFSTIYTHFEKLKGCTTYLTLKSLAEIEDQQPDAALADVLLSFHMGETIRTEPFLISHLVRLGFHNISLLGLKQGLANHIWNEGQLLTLDQALAKRDFIQDYQTAMRGERAGSLFAFDYMRRERNFDYMGDAPSALETGSLLGQAIGNSPLYLLPAGWFDQNKVAVSRMHVELVLPAVDVQARIVSPKKTSQMETSALDSVATISPYNMFSRMLLQAFSHFAQRFAAAQTSVDSARIAIALERHRLAHGNYPETLDALVPQFIAKLPHDVINSQPDRKSVV